MDYIQGRIGLKCILMILITITAIPVIGLVVLITGSLTLGLLVYLLCIYGILRYIGRFAMYPGSTQYVQSQVESRIGSELLRNCQNCLNNIQYLNQRITQKQFFVADTQMGSMIQRSIRSIIEMFSAYQLTLSIRKTRLLSLYRRLLIEFEAQSPSIDQNNGNVSILQLANNPQNMKKKKYDEQFILDKFNSINQIITQVQVILFTFQSPLPTQSFFKRMKFFLFAEKLYQIRFAFTNWNYAFIYDRHLVPTNDGKTIETVVIHQQKNQREINSQKTVLFCNPNGVFVQFFGIQNSYIRFYLRNGFKVILWNYRGYGASTGTPTIRQSQKDGQMVYQFYKNLNYDIKVVHGYSIGGCSAIGIANKYHSIDILIADRTFSQISNMAQSYGKVLHYLTKLVFLRDDIELHQQFQECKNPHKMIIWDQYDEVISEYSSLKMGILLGFSQKIAETNNPPSQNFLSNISDKFEDQEKQLAYQESSPTDYNFQQELVHRFAKAFQNIFFNHEEVQSGQPMLSSNKFQEDVIDIFKQLDGGGIILFEKSKIDHMLEHSKVKNFQIYHNYLISLSYYGCCLPIFQNQMSHQLIKNSTINRIQTSLKKANDIELALKNNGSKSSKINSLHQLCQIFKEVEKIIYITKNDTDFHQKIGVLMPTSNGHNCDLLNIQYDAIKSLICRQYRQIIQNENRIN